MSRYLLCLALTGFVSCASVTLFSICAPDAPALMDAASLDAIRAAA